MTFLLINNKKIRSHRLSVRTRGFHPRKRGSIPLGTAIYLFMFYFVYMIKSISSQKSKTYVGYTKNIQNRLLQHNSNKGAKSTKGYIWKVIYKKKFSSKKMAMSYEYKLKKNRKKRLSILKQN